MLLAAIKLFQLVSVLPCCPFSSGEQSCAQSRDNQVTPDGTFLSHTPLTSGEIWLYHSYYSSLGLLRPKTENIYHSRTNLLLAYYLQLAIPAQGFACLSRKPAVATLQGQGWSAVVWFQLQGIKCFSTVILFNLLRLTSRTWKWCWKPHSLEWLFGT